MASSFICMAIVIRRPLILPSLFFRVFSFAVSEISPAASFFRSLASGRLFISATASMGFYEPFHKVCAWETTFITQENSDTDGSAIVKVDAELNNRPDMRNDQEANKTVDKVQRRLAQNREAARKSRQRKKAYVQQLETSCLRLAQLEQELYRARQQDAYFSYGIDSSNFGLNPVFEMEYGQWVDEQQRQSSELRNALQAHATEMELRILVEGNLNHYYSLLRMKAVAAKSDVFYIMSGIWRSSAERFFLWIGGFRPSELLNVLMPHFEPLNDEQESNIRNLRVSSQQAEDALLQGMEKLHQNLIQGIDSVPISAESYGSQMVNAIDKLVALEDFLSQADHLREQMLLQMSSILSIKQAAQGLVGLAEYFRRLRVLSSLWSARPLSWDSVNSLASL